jgi:hypothetical protein
LVRLPLAVHRRRSTAPWSEARGELFDTINNVKAKIHNKEASLPTNGTSAHAFVIEYHDNGNSEHHHLDLPTPPAAPSHEIYLFYQQLSIGASVYFICIKPPQSPNLLVILQSHIDLFDTNAPGFVDCDGLGIYHVALINTSLSSTLLHSLLESSPVAGVLSTLPSLPPPPDGFHHAILHVAPLNTGRSGCSTDSLHRFAMSPEWMGAHILSCWDQFEGKK